MSEHGSAAPGATGSRGTPRDSAHLALSHRKLSAPAAIAQAQAAADRGWGGVWAPEFLGLDALALMTTLAHTTQHIRLGTCIVPISTRSPALLAMSASTVAQLAPGRFTLGLGVSTPQVVGRRHGRPVQRPLTEMRGVVEVVRAALSGAAVSHEADPAIDDLRIEAPAQIPHVVIAALGPKMTALAYQAADGAMLNLQTYDAVEQRVRADPSIVEGGSETVVVMRVCVDPTPEDLDVIRKEIVGYSRVAAYADSLSRQGLSFEDVASGDLAAAASRLSGDVVDALTIHGSSDHCRERIRAFADLGVVPVVLPVGTSSSVHRVIDRLDPEL